MRRVVVLSVAVACLLGLAVPAGALTRVRFEGAPRAYTLSDVCPFEIRAQERDTHPGFLTYDEEAIVEVTYGGSFETVLESSLGVLAFDTIGTTTVTANGDGTWTMVQKGSGLAVVPRDDPEGSKLVWFTGRVVSVGDFDPKSLEFTPRVQTRSGITGNVCEMLVTGLKNRHDT